MGLESMLNAITNPINLIIIIIIVILGFIDLFLKKDLKSQIVSLGVLGTFIGIFMGLQDFNPANMKDSINTILIGLKTAFFTSIMGMGTALFLSIYQKLSSTKTILQEQENKREEFLLNEISGKLNLLSNIDNSIEKNFTQMNHSLELAIKQLSKGATKEIIEALRQVIENFNQELQTQFGENFIKLNESVINLVQWQNNYKTHIETLEDKLSLTVTSMEKSKKTLEIISSKNSEILEVYQRLEEIINIYDIQIRELNTHLKTFALLGQNARNMFSNIQDSINITKNEFINLSENIISKNQKLQENLEKNTKQLEVITNHFKNMGQEIPKALNISLEQLNRGLTSLTVQFQKDYKEIMDGYKRGMKY
jgi:acyl carrier protein phosphodiesterase